MQTRKPKRPKANWTTVKGAKISQKQPHKRIRFATPSRAKQLREYAKRAKAFLAAHPYCAVFNFAREVFYETEGYFPPNMASEIHHFRGRRNKLLLDERYWLSVSGSGHSWIHSNIDGARKFGLIAEQGDWGKSE
jgi:hypothetical protein